MSLPRWHSVALSARDVSREAAPELDGSSALDRISIDVLERQLTAVMGPGASGKSTLLRILAGLELPDGGSVSCEGTAGGGIALVAPPRRAGWLPRAISRLALSERGGAAGSEPGSSSARFDTLEAALAAEPAILLADDRGAGVWSRGERDRVETLRGWVEGGRRTAVMVTGDPLAATHADRVVFLARGSIVGDLERPELGEVLDAIALQGG